MATRDTVEYSGNTYAILDAAGTPTVYLMNGRSRASEVTGATKTAVLAEFNSTPTDGDRVRIRQRSTRPTNWAPVEIDTDTGELYEFTGR